MSGEHEASAAGAETAEVDLSRWYDNAEAAATARFTVVARRLPALIRESLRLAWRAGRADTVATIVLNLVSGIFTAFGLLATTGVLDALLAAGPTPDRVRAALPSLLLVGGAGTARAVLSAVRRHMRGRTVVLITHRLANIRYADVIHVLEHGKITASGSHDELMAVAGTYRELYELQAAAYEN